MPSEAEENPPSCAEMSFNDGRGPFGRLSSAARIARRCSGIVPALELRPTMPPLCCHLFACHHWQGIKKNCLELQTWRPFASADPRLQKMLSCTFPTAVDNHVKDNGDDQYEDAD